MVEELWNARVDVMRTRLARATERMESKVERVLVELGPTPEIRADLDSDSD